jgi:hypothetical protein
MAPMKTDDTNPAGWQRVAAAMEARAVELGWTLTRLDDETEISETSRLAMRKGQPVKKPAKLAVLCKALGWTPDSVTAILEGGEPTLVDYPSVDEITRRLDEIAELVRSLERGQQILAKGQKSGLGALERALPRLLAAAEVIDPSSRQAAQ